MKNRRETQKEESPMQDADDLLYATTPEGVAYRENGLRNVEAALLAKTDWASPQARVEAFAQFYTLATQLRAIDVQVLSDRTTETLHQSSGEVWCRAKEGDLWRNGNENV